MSNPYGYEGWQSPYSPQPGYEPPPPPRANPVPALVTLFTLAFLMLAGGGFSLYVVLTDEPSAPAAPTRQAVIQPSTEASQPASPPASPSSPAQNAESPPPAQPPAAARGALLSDSGAGNKTTAQFTADDSWQIHYTYDCTANPLGTGHVSATLKAGEELVETPFTELGTKADKTIPQSRAGTFHLEVISIGCEWTIEVTDLL
ncbi:hypothetical protein Aph01nite_69580 [Acrocarpospora phusangensis]|uniref:Uncharacterized protein n=1 Tax=Acrocarpospora phusangensis TaxID=1070424 RepID=A0A919QJ78_9ACTN|nr:hypothetical protein [Acrocarpospora phusangensis]GIH28648.1 hypothetical protein Aph01nite_69580 [Acrocarpospora phusangensis]